MLIVDNFRIGFQSSSRKKRLRTAFKAAIHSKHVQRFRESLNETKATLTLALVHERYETDEVHLNVTKH
jgi:glutamate synthase domain-containing protein 1